MEREREKINGKEEKENVDDGVMNESREEPSGIKTRITSFRSSFPLSFSSLFYSLPLSPSLSLCVWVRFHREQLNLLACLTIQFLLLITNHEYMFHAPPFIDDDIQVWHSWFSFSKWKWEVIYYANWVIKSREANQVIETYIQTFRTENEMDMREERERGERKREGERRRERQREREKWEWKGNECKDHLTASIGSSRTSYRWKCSNGKAFFVNSWVNVGRKGFVMKSNIFSWHLEREGIFVLMDREEKEKVWQKVRQLLNDCFLIETSRVNNVQIHSHSIRGKNTCNRSSLLFVHRCLGMSLSPPVIVFLSLSLSFSLSLYFFFSLPVYLYLFLSLSLSCKLCPSESPLGQVERKQK